MVKAVMGALLPPSVRDKIVLVRRHHQLVRCAVDLGSNGHAHDWTAAQVVRGMRKSATQTWPLGKADTPEGSQKPGSTLSNMHTSQA